MAILAATVVAVAPAAAVPSPSGHDLKVSLQPDRSAPVALDGATLGGPAYVFVQPETGLKRVRFHLDGALVQTDRKAPWDLQGGSATAATAFDFGTLTPGAHEVAAELLLSNGSTQTASARFTVPDASRQLVVSKTADRAAPVALEGSTAAGNIYVFVTPETGASQVRFWVDDTARAGVPVRTETVAPYDLAGTATSGAANPFDTTTLTDGSHTVTAEVVLTAGGTQVVNAAFQVQNAGTPPPPPPPGAALVVSASPNRSSPLALAGQELSGLQYIFVAPTTGITRVEFFLDNPTMTGTPYRVEGSAPFDLAGTATNGDANPLNTTSLGVGTHEVTARLTKSDATTQLISGTFAVASAATCGLVPCSSIKVAAPYTLGFDADRGGIVDGAGVGTGFTYLDPPANGTGYEPSLLAVDRTAGALRMTTAAGVAARTTNTLVNALGVGFDVPGGLTRIRTTVVSPPAGTGNFEQGGLWFGTDQDHYVKLVVISTPSGPAVEFVYEDDGAYVGTFQTPVASLAGKRVALQFDANPVDRKVTASFTIDGGAPVVVGSIVVAGELFSFDAAGIDPRIGTRSFTGVHASHRLARPGDLRLRRLHARADGAPGRRPGRLRPPLQRRAQPDLDGLRPRRPPLRVRAARQDPRPDVRRQLERRR